MQATQHEKAAAFCALHEGEAFVIPNPWDAGSAKVLAGLGFKALATTSSGLAFTLGRLDGGATLDETLEHARQLDRATSLPVSVDLENGYGRDPEHTAAAIARTAEAGAVGGSIEDYDPDGTIYSRQHAAERIAAACETARRLDFPFLVTARAENFIRGNTDLEDTILRLQAYEQAGADVLYAPGLRTADEIRSVCSAITKPVNVLARPNLSLREIADAGARRISVGGRLTWVSVNAVVDAATAIRDHGDFSALDSSPEFEQWLDPLSGRDRRPRGSASVSLAGGRRKTTTFLVVRHHSGPQYDPSRSLQEQSDWPAHVSFMNELEAAGFIVVGGPLAGERRTVLVVEAESEHAVRGTLARDPWSETHLQVDTIEPWSIRLGSL